MLSTRYEYSVVSMLYEDPPTVLNIRESQLCNRNYVIATQHHSIHPSAALILTPPTSTSSPKENKG